MKRLLITAAILAVSSPAMANSTSTNPVVNFQGERAQVCEVRNFEASVDFGALSSTGAGATILDEVELFCNVQFTASLESDNGFLKLDTTVGDAQPVSQADTTAQGYSAFAAALDYQITTAIGVGDTTSIGATSPLALPGTNAPIAATTTIYYDTVPGTKPLLAGVYEDTLTLTITPVSF